MIELLAAYAKPLESAPSHMAFKSVYPDVDPDSEPTEQPELANGSHSADNPAKQPQDKATPSVLQKLQKWGDYEAFGDVVRPALLIPMKTPLSKAILSEWTLPEQPKHSLTIDSLLQQQHFRQRQIGMIIDLSNHETLYADDIPPSIQYQHIQLVAKVFPDPCQVHPQSFSPNVQSMVFVNTAALKRQLYRNIRTCNDIYHLLHRWTRS